MARINLDYFNATLNHAGNILHGIPLNGISARELKFLRKVHGDGNIGGVVKVAEHEVDEREHFFQIARKYGSHEDMTKQERVVKQLEELFGVEMGDFHQWLDQVQQAEDDEKTSAGRARAAEAAAYAQKREAEIRAEAEAKVRAEVAASLGVSVEDLAMLKKPPQPAAEIPA